MSKNAPDRLELTAIELTTGAGAKVRLTVEEARALYGQLEELFGSKVTYVPSQPVYIYPDRWRPYRLSWDTNNPTSGRLTCRDSSGLSVRYSGVASSAT